MKFISKYLIVFIILSFAIKSSKTNYDFDTPYKKIFLPEILNEISGISIIDSTLFACVQDENGIVYIYDFNKNIIVKQINFGEDGDYEGIAVVANSIFVLRSDGVLYEIVNYLSEKRIIKKHSTGISTLNNEGLCFDFLNNRLLIASKSKYGLGSESKYLRAIYSFDLKNYKLQHNPLFKLDIREIESKLYEKQKKSFKLRPSAININPIDQKLYLLSASDYKLFIFNQKGEFEKGINLNNNIYNKSEGITFLKNGDLLISNEGQNNRASVIFLKLKGAY